MGNGMTVKTRLGIGFGILVIAMGCVAGLSLHALSDENDRFTLRFRRQS